MVPYITIKHELFVLVGKHENREHSFQPVNQAGRRIKIRLMFCVIFVLSYIIAFQLLPYSYYNPYKAPALIKASERFPDIKLI